MNDFIIQIFLTHYFVLYQEDKSGKKSTAITNDITALIPIRPPVVTKNVNRVSVLDSIILNITKHNPHRTIKANRSFLFSFFIFLYLLLDKYKL